jgi:perosamine synthetase
VATALRQLAGRGAVIPISQPSLSAREADYVADAVRSGWVSSLGHYVDRFEEQFAEFCGVRYAVSVANGTVGLHLAFKVLGIGPGDEVIVPDLTFVATGNAVVTAAAVPIMVDVRRDSWCIDVDRIEAAITSRTRAIVPVHLYGHPADMPAITALANKHGLHVIEDAAEAHGASIAGRRVGALGDCGIFSFYGNKIITTGEGGMITTNDPAIHARARHLRDHAMSKEVRYWHTEVGYNYRMTNIQAALGLGQLEQIDSFIGQRAAILDDYRRRLEPHGIVCNPRLDAEPVNWITCALVEGLGRDRRDAVAKKLKESGVDTRPFFFPMSHFPMYAMLGADNPVAASLSQDGFNLPTFVGMTKSQIAQVCDTFLGALAEQRG